VVLPVPRCRVLGKKKEYWHYGNNDKLKREIYAERNREPCTQIWNTLMGERTWQS
jgi:hypothetical protein